MKPKEPAEPALPPPASDIEALLREHAIARDALLLPGTSATMNARHARFRELDAELARWKAANGPFPEEALDAVQRTHPDVQTRVRRNHPGLYAIE